MADETYYSAHQPENPGEQPEVEKQSIGDLPAQAGEKAVYLRESGAIYVKLNEQFHVKARLSDDGQKWLGVGMTETLDPDELVLRIQ